MRSFGKVSYDTLVDISGLPKALVLAALYNVAPATADGSDHFMTTMDRRSAEALLARADEFHELLGRRVPIDLSDANWIDSADFDAIYGQDITALIVESLRVTGAPCNQTTELLSNVIAARAAARAGEPLAGDIVALFDLAPRDVAGIANRYRGNRDTPTRINALVTCASLALAKAELMRKHLVEIPSGEVGGLGAYVAWGTVAKNCLGFLGDPAPQGVGEEIAERVTALETHVAILHALERTSVAAKSAGAEPPAL